MNKITTFKITSLGETEIQIEPCQCIFVDGNDHIVGVEIENEVILHAADEIRMTVSSSRNRKLGQILATLLLIAGVILVAVAIFGWSPTEVTP